MLIIGTDMSCQSLARQCQQRRTHRESGSETLHVVAARDEQPGLQRLAHCYQREHRSCNRIYLYDGQRTHQQADAQ